MGQSTRTFTGRRARRAASPVFGRRHVPRFEQMESRTVLSVNVLSSFAGLDFSKSGGYVPPDTNGAAGPTRYVETVNQTIGLYDKSTGAELTRAALSTFFFTTGKLARAGTGSGLSDPVVAYDEYIGRFIVGDQDVNFSTHISTFDLAVSKTSTPASLSASDWNFYRIVTTESGFDADYPGNFGYNRDALVFTLNMFGVSGGGHTKVVSVNTTDLQNGVVAPQIFLNNLNDFSMRPTTMHGSVAGDPMWLVTEHGDNKTIDVVKMSNVLSGSPSFAYTNMAVTSYSSAVAPKNPNGTAITTNLDSRILKAASYGGTLVATHTVATSATQDVAQWYNVNLAGATPSLADQGRISAGNGTYVFFPGIDINPSGQIGMSYMKSGTDTSTDYMSMYVTGRVPGDPAGTMESPVLVPKGTGLANYKDFSGGGRAGDLSGINVDPVDGTFWAVSEYANTQATANWGTAAAHFALSSPIPSTDLAVSVTGPTGVDVTAGARNVTYTITVSNNGASAGNLVLTDTLPAGTSFVSLSQSSGPDAFTISQSGGTATATASAPVSSGSTDVFTLIVSVPTGIADRTNLVNTASVSSDNPESNPSDNSSSFSTKVTNSSLNADLSLKITGPATANEGDTLTYTLTVTNKGPNPATSVVLTDTLDPNQRFKSATAGQGTFSASAGLVTFTVGTIGAGATVTFTVAVQAMEEGSLPNNVAITSSTPDPVSSNNTATAVTAVAEPVISVSFPKTSNKTVLTDFVAATFSHAKGVEPPSAFAATINWGDGTTSAGIITLSNGGYTVTGSHTYAAGVKHTISVSVVEVGGTPNSAEKFGKIGDERPGRGPWWNRDIVRLPARLRYMLHHR